MYPLIRCDLHKLRDNARTLSAACHQKGIHLSVVTKVFCAEPGIVAALTEYADSLADSRLPNLARLPEGKSRLMLRLADPRQAEDTVRLANQSLQSEPESIQALGQAAEALKKPHGIILMIDLGDLREGLMYNNRSAILHAARAVKDKPYLTLAGIGVNLSCFGGIVPDADNLDRLVSIATWLRQELDLPIPIVSGGNSSSIGLMLAGGLPQGINHLRIGEGLLLGRDTALGQPFPFLHQDVFTLSAVLGEVQQKPSQPIGTVGPNAFGEQPSFPDLGPMRRGIALIGRQDTDAEGLRPRDSRVQVLGASSDHLVLDMSAAPEYSVGDVLHFDVSYGALLKAYTSAYVGKALV